MSVESVEDLASQLDQSLLQNLKEDMLKQLSRRLKVYLREQLDNLYEEIPRFISLYEGKLQTPPLSFSFISPNFSFTIMSFVNVRR